MADPKTTLLIRWARDLSTCTSEEIRERWSDPVEQEAIDLLDAEVGGFDGRLEKHNPIYYLAERVFFDNVADDPVYLYAPLHRDKFCKFALDYFMDPDPQESGALFHGPRETYKSTLVQAIMLWLLLRWKHLKGIDVRLVLRHHKEEMASAAIVLFKAKFLTHAWLREVWADACPDYNDKQWGTQTYFTLPWVKPGTIREYSVIGVGLTSSQTGYHNDFTFNDDLVTEEHRKSAQVREDAKTRYAAMRYQLDATRGRELNTGTPYHPRDLGMMMQEATVEDDDGNKRPIYRKMIVEALSDDGVYAHPYRLNEKFLNKRRQEEISLHGNDDYWYLQYQCRTALLRTQVASSAWLRKISIDEVEHSGLPVVTVDGAWKGTENQGKGDSAAIQLWLLQRQGGVITRTLLDGIHSNELSSTDGEKEIFRLMGKWGAYHVAPEEHGGQVFRTNLRNTAVALGMKLVLIDLKMKQTQKHNRIVAFLKELECGRIFVASSCTPEVLSALEAQIDGYHGPETLDHDDAVDAGAYSCDPAIVEKWVPVWGAALPQAPWMRVMMARRAQENPPRTRYCMD
jgi:hypothetical protein